jgi:hypothetical protein
MSLVIFNHQGKRVSLFEKFPIGDRGVDRTVRDSYDWPLDLRVLPLRPWTYAIITPTKDQGTAPLNIGWYHTTRTRGYHTPENVLLSTCNSTQLPI